MAEISFAPLSITYLGDDNEEVIANEQYFLFGKPDSHIELYRWHPHEQTQRRWNGKQIWRWQWVNDFPYEAV